MKNLFCKKFCVAKLVAFFCLGLQLVSSAQAPAPFTITNNRNCTVGVLYEFYDDPCSAGDPACIWTSSIVYIGAGNSVTISAIAGCGNSLSSFGDVYVLLQEIDGVYVGPGYGVGDVAACVFTALTAVSGPVPAGVSAGCAIPATFNMTYASTGVLIW